ncbi:HCP-like protein [Rhizophagus irregularis]|uniref:HCP-like protein n=1 Tax=Rhizophagus irregularis TaxID=588596 RepID=A0A2N1MPD2_9GLOM|nr:HCP-like protein [Rhizophagus irregularis]
MLGYCYRFGFGTYIHLQKAAELYRKAANLGNKVAQCNLALMYEKGYGFEKNTNIAIYWYRESAKQGYQDAQHRLGVFWCDY